MQERIIRNKITIISFISSLLVIYFHTRNLGVYGIEKTTLGIGKLCFLLETRTEGLLSLATPIFFFISGLLFFRTFELNKIIDKYESRFFSLVIPYIIWCTIYYLYFVVLSSLPTTSNLIPADMTRELSLRSWINCLFDESYYVLWFLKNLIIYVAISPVIYLALKNHKANMYSGLLLLVIVEILLANYGNSMLLDGLNYYLLGSYIGINHKSLLYFKNRKISFISICYLLLETIFGFKYSSFVFNVFFILCLWYALDFLNLNKALPWWTNVTFLSYVAHDAILEALEKIILILFGQNHLVALLVYIFMPILVETIIIVIAYLLNRYMPKLYLILTGNRQIRSN